MPRPLSLLLERYGARRPDDHATVAQFAALLAEPGPVFTRAHRTAHFTGSALVLSADGQRTLLLHHAKLDRWLQPGGHADGDTDLAAVALREAQEETGLQDLRLVDGEILDLDRHRIPARGDEPEHWRYDVRFAVQATGDESPRGNHESRGLRWVAVAALADDTTLEPSLRRLAQRWLQHPGA